MKKIIYSLVILLSIISINIKVKAADNCTSDALRPCFSGVCESSNGSILEKEGPTRVNGNQYTQFACRGSGDVTVTCQRVGYTIIYRHHVVCRGAAEENSNGGSTGGENSSGGNASSPGTNSTPNSDTLKSFCDVNENPGVMRAFKLGGVVLNILKIMIPLLLIILGGIDFAQAVISSDEKQISKSTMKLVQRVIAGIAIFIAPQLIEYVFDLVDNNATNKYQTCYQCLLDVSKCPDIPKVGS